MEKSLCEKIRNNFRYVENYIEAHFFFFLFCCCFVLTGYLCIFNLGRTVLPLKDRFTCIFLILLQLIKTK